MAACSYSICIAATLLVTWGIWCQISPAVVSFCNVSGEDNVFGICTAAVAFCNVSGDYYNNLFNLKLNLHLDKLSNLSVFILNNLSVFLGYLNLGSDLKLYLYKLFNFNLNLFGMCIAGVAIAAATWFLRQYGQRQRAARHVDSTAGRTTTVDTWNSRQHGAQLPLGQRQRAVRQDGQRKRPLDAQDSTAVRRASSDCDVLKEKVVQQLYRGGAGGSNTTRRKRLLASLTELLAAEDEEDEDGEDTEMTALLNTLEGFIKKARRDGGASLVDDLKKAILGTATRETKEQEHLRTSRPMGKGAARATVKARG